MGPATQIRSLLLTMGLGTLGIALFLPVVLYAANPKIDSRNYYERLGIDREVIERARDNKERRQIIENAYIDVARNHATDPSAMDSLKQAYVTLIVPEKREAHDQYLENQKLIDGVLANPRNLFGGTTASGMLEEIPGMNRKDIDVETFIRARPTIEQVLQAKKGLFELYQDPALQWAQYETIKSQSLPHRINSLTIWAIHELAQTPDDVLTLADPSPPESTFRKNDYDFDKELRYRRSFVDYVMSHSDDWLSVGMTPDLLITLVEKLKSSLLFRDQVPDKWKELSREQDKKTYHELQKFIVKSLAHNHLSPAPTKRQVKTLSNSIPVPFRSNTFGADVYKALNSRRGSDDCPYNTLVM